MAVSLNQVQALLPGQTTPQGGASGSLTLTVLHKTEALLQQLKPLEGPKNHTIQVLKAHGNGRAEVQVGRLTLDVKASLPLKAGDVFQLKFEQVGSALRFISSAGQEATLKQSSSAQALDQKSQVQQGLNSNGSPAAPPKAPPGAKGLAQNVQSGALHTQSQNPQLGKSAVHQTALPSFQGATGHQGTTGQQITQTGQGSQLNQQQTTQLPQSLSSTPAGPPAIKAGTTHLHGPLSPSSPLQKSGAVLSTSPVLATHNTSTALLRAVTEILPDVARKIDAQNKNATGSQKAGTLRTGGTSLGDVAQSVQGRATLQASETALASYKALASQGKVEEVQDIKGFPNRPADLQLDLPLADGQRSLAVSLFLDQERERQQTAETDKGHGVRFALQSEATGKIFAELTLKETLVKLALWADRDAVAEQIVEALPLLKTRLEATGFVVGGIVIRHGEPPVEGTQSSLEDLSSHKQEENFETIEHVDEEI